MITVTSLTVQMPPPVLHVIHNFTFAILANVFVTENGVKASGLTFACIFISSPQPPSR